MRYFKLPLIVTGIVLVLAIAIGIAGIVVITNSGASDKDKATRGGMLGSGLGTLTVLVIAPFWIFAAAKFGKDRREAQELAKSAAKTPNKKKRKE